MESSVVAVISGWNAERTSIRQGNSNSNELNRCVYLSIEGPSSTGLHTTVLDIRIEIHTTVEDVLSVPAGRPDPKLHVGVDTGRHTSWLPIVPDWLSFHIGNGDTATVAVNVAAVGAGDSREVVHGVEDIDPILGMCGHGHDGSEEEWFEVHDG